MKIKEIFNKPKVISVVSDVNQGKSMFLYHLIKECGKEHKFNLFYYGLRLDVGGAQRIHSIEELEAIQNSIIVVDELSSLFDLDNRKSRKLIENTLRLINHNNNILVLCGTPENFKKFLSAKIDEFFYKKGTIADFINGSVVKSRLLAYKGYELGSAILNMKIDKVLHFNGKHYKTYHVPYYKECDSKADNVKILQKKKVR